MTGTCDRGRRRWASTRGRLLLLAGVVAVAAAGSSVYAGDSASGLHLARQWCVECHVVEAGQAIASDAWPPFSEVANNPVKTERGLRTWLSDPHPPMPQLNLSKTEIENLLAYIQSLASD